MKIVDNKERFLELRDAMETMVSLNGGSSLTNIKWWLERDCYVLDAKFNKSSYITIIFDVRNKFIEITSNIEIIKNETALIREFEKICAKPKKVISWNFSSDDTRIFRCLHRFKISSKNVEKMYDIFILVLKLYDEK